MFRPHEVCGVEQRMKSMKFTRPSTTLALFALATVANSSELTEDSGWYIGGNAGQSRAEVDDRRITTNLVAAGLTPTSLDKFQEHFGFELFGGYQFNPYFALEGGYYDLGRFGFEADTNPAGTLRGEIKVRGADFDAIGILPFTERFAAFGRVGVTYVDTTDSFSGTGAVIVLDPGPSKHRASYKFGVGLQYAITTAFGLRAEAERYRVDDAVGRRGDIDLISLGVVYRFHGAARPNARTAAEPAVKPAPESVPVPEVVPVVVPLAPKLQKYCSILDFQFEVNQDGIQRQEIEKLRVIGTFLTKYPDTSAVIEGYADNVGMPEANMRLSQRRADSVVRYLVRTVHIDSSRLSAVGYGDSHPVGDNRTEEGKRMNRRIAAVVECTTDIPGLTVRPARVTMALEVEFDRDEVDIKPEFHDEIGRLADFLASHPSVTATVEGHAANQATRALALSISQLRAQNLMNYLVNNFGVARSRLTAEGFGDSRRFAYNTSLQGQQENRRVNVIINYPK
jgi:OmpA-OmpF porin, OOP family